MNRKACISLTARFGLRFTTPRQVSVWQKKPFNAHQPFQGLIMKLEKEEEHEL